MTLRRVPPGPDRLALLPLLELADPIAASYLDEGADGVDQAFDVEIDADDRILMIGWTEVEVTVPQGKGGKTKTVIRRLSVLVRLLAERLDMR